MLPNSDKISALIVDDSEHVRALLSMLLKKEGVTRIHQAMDGEAGVAMYKEHKPTLTFLDNMLPKLPGMEVLAQIRSFDPAAKVIMISAISTPEVVQEAKVRGASHYLIKPYSSQKLLEVVRRVLDIPETSA